MMVSIAGLFTSLLLLAAVIAAPLPMSSQVEILRISGVAESDIEHTLNPNHVLASAFESPSHGSTNQHSIALRPASTDEEFQFTQAIDGYSTAKLTPNSPSPASASLGNLAITIPVGSSSQGAFDRVRKWIMNRDPTDEGAMFVTGRMGEIKVRGR